MPFSIRPYRRFPVQCSVRCHVVPFLTLPLAYVLGFGALITLLLLSSGPAYAEWVSIGASNQRERTVYTDPDTIRLKGDVVTMWSLNDYTTIQTMGSTSYLSSKVHTEYDCAEERIRTLASMFFSGNMGSGDVVYSISKEGKWQLLEPGSLGQSEWEVACDKE
jgi:surface-adhesin protein E